MDWGVGKFTVSCEGKSMMTTISSVSTVSAVTVVWVAVAIGSVSVVAVVTAVTVVSVTVVTMCMASMRILNGDLFFLIGGHRFFDDGDCWFLDDFCHFFLDNMLIRRRISSNACGRFNARVGVDVRAVTIMCVGVVRGCRWGRLMVVSIVSLEPSVYSVVSMVMTVACLTGKGGIRFTGQAIFWVSTAACIRGRRNRGVVTVVMAVSVSSIVAVSVMTIAVVTVSVVAISVVAISVVAVSIVVIRFGAASVSVSGAINTMDRGNVFTRIDAISRVLRVDLNFFNLLGNFNIFDAMNFLLDVGCFWYELGDVLGVGVCIVMLVMIIMFVVVAGCNSCEEKRNLEEFHLKFCLTNCLLISLLKWISASKINGENL